MLVYLVSAFNSPPSRRYISEFAPSTWRISGRNVVVCSDNKIKIIDDEGQEIAEYDLKEDKSTSTAFGDFVVVSFSGDVSAKGSELGVLDIGAINAETDTISERFDHDENNNDSIFKWDRRLEGSSSHRLYETVSYSRSRLGIYSMGISRNGKEKLTKLEAWLSGMERENGSRLRRWVANYCQR